MPARRPPAPLPLRPYAVLIDGSALFLAVKDEDRKLNYFGLVDVLCLNAPQPGPQRPDTDHSSLWTMWTSAESRNPGQVKFLEFAEQRLGWRVRGVAPYRAYMIEPDALFGVGGSSEARAQRLLRFDAQIAFAMGRLAETHRLLVVSDSYALAEPMARVNDAGGLCSLAFFGHALETRWLSALRDTDSEGRPKINFIDLDAHASGLFGTQEREVTRQGDVSGTHWY